MRVYHGERTDDGCKVTVDGVPLRVRSDLSGASAAFDWGYVGNGQLSLALLSDLPGNEPKVKALCKRGSRAAGTINPAPVMTPNWSTLRRQARGRIADSESDDRC